MWNNATSLKVRCFGRLSWVDRVKNSEWLLRLGILVEPNHGLCKLCGSGLETVNHLLIWWDFSWQLWFKILRWWVLLWVVPGSFGSLLEWWKGFKFKKAKRVVWRVIPFAIFWSVWLCKNSAVFSNLQPVLEDVFDIVKWRVIFWAKQKKELLNLNVRDLVFCDFHVADRL